MPVFKRILGMPMKLSNRLKQIEKMVESYYDHIWDCCCDHGFLGAALLSRQSEANIHFVDIVPELIEKIENKLNQFYPGAQWETHCMDIVQLPLPHYAGRHLVIIAGVGGNLTTQFVEALHTQYPMLNIDFLLCPVLNQFSLREKLIELNFGLKREVLIEDKQRFYEILLVSSSKNDTAEISPIGNQIWRSDSDTQATVIKRYWHKTINHYRRIQQGKTEDVQPIIDAYLKAMD